jgi:RNA-directed DNA polymerase
VYDPRTRRILGIGLAHAFLAGEWSEDAMTRRGREALEPSPRWLRRVVREVLGAYPRPPVDRPRELSRFVALAIERLPRVGWGSHRPEVRRWFAFEEEMGRRRWPVADLPTLDELAALLGLGSTELDWLADARGLERTAESERLRNYRYAWLPRRGAPPRLIERPKARLKGAQRIVLREILNPIPPHEAAHGFTPGRSVRTHAATHLGSALVLRLDLEDFFASVEARRVYGIFRSAGYSESVAHSLTALCTNVVPLHEWNAAREPVEPALIAAHWRLGRRLATPHLPQGAPTSPALANLAAQSLDIRLAGLAKSLGARYTRYADDLAISGPRWLRRRADGIAEAVDGIALDEGFRLNPAKTRAMPRAGRQRLCGIVVNERPNVTRREYDRLKAILHNAARNGPERENRAGVPDFRAHLIGRIAWVEHLNPERGRRLRERFARIAWE